MAGNQEAFDKAAARVLLNQDKYKGFCSDTGRTPRPDRLQVTGYDKKTAQDVKNANFANMKKQKVDIDRMRKKAYNDDKLMPNAITATTAEEKMKGYILNPLSKDGASKSELIGKVLGYNQANWEVLANKLFNGIQTTPYSAITKTEYGTKYKIPLKIVGETGRELTLNTIWQIDNGSNIPRFITTTFPKKGGKNV